MVKLEIPAADDAAFDDPSLRIGSLTIKPVLVQFDAIPAVNVRTDRLAARQEGRRTLTV